MTQLSDSEPEVGRSNENSKDTSTNEPKKVKKETKQSKKETKPNAKKETKPNAKKETKPNAKKVAKKKPAASNAEPEKSENPVVPEVVTRETAGGLCCHAIEEDGYRLRPYKQRRQWRSREQRGTRSRCCRLGSQKHRHGFFCTKRRLSWLCSLTMPNNPSPKPFKVKAKGASLAHPHSFPKDPLLE